MCSTGSVLYGTGIMQYGLFVVLVGACFVTCFEVVVASISEDTVVYGSGGRLLRTSGVGDDARDEKLEGEDRANAFLDWAKSLVKAKKPAPDSVSAPGLKSAQDLKRTFPSPPVADKLVRSKSLELKKAKEMAKTLRRSESAKFGVPLDQIAPKSSTAIDKDLRQIYKMNAEYTQLRTALDQVVQKTSVNGRDLQQIYKTERNPDDIVRVFKLDTKLTKRGTTLKQLKKESKSDRQFREYKLWHSYSKFFKKRNPNWASKFSSS
ncbi:unnamed protein product [Phytophthora fragariaefolia]|uniref:Unnamed protein product n=1 Tax=Phytophthora fragariaefolia TaxID=1490495 RepID=A0A9W6X9B0_9STRA|nr:unnamed protein product [Phytophthora fragariaefolia]